jgi:circadian clock protein KaiC
VKQMATGVAGLDVVLSGGMEEGALVVMAGAPGTGKTILAHQLCFAVGTAEHKCVYYTTVSEPHAKLVAHLESFAFFDAQSLGTRVEHIHLGDMLQPGTQDALTPLVAEIVRKTEEEEPAIVVIDSAKMLRDFADERELRRALYDLTSRFAHTDATLLLLGEYAPEELGSGTEFSLADVIIQLEFEPREPVDRRSLRVVKMRGGPHVPGKHTMQIDAGGVRIFPRIETLVPANVAPVSGRISSGIPGLDELMAGGMRQGDASLVIGPSGVGKTTFGMRWLAQGLEEGQSCLFITLQDSVDHLTEMAAIFGWDVAAARASGQLVISYIPTGNLDMDVMADTVRAHLAASPMRRVVIDSLAELVLATREWDRFPAYMRSIVALVRSVGSSMMITSETTSSSLAAQSMERLMFLFDNVIELRYIEQQTGLGRALNVVKMRNGAHKTTLNSVTITHNGFEVGDELDGVTGRLGWSALRAQDPLYLPSPARLPSPRTS